MTRLVANFIDALIPLAFAVLILASPQLFTKKDLKADENRKLAAKLRTLGWVLMASGVLVLIASIGSALSKE